mgnify:CR=1 FL=1
MKPIIRKALAITGAAATAVITVALSEWISHKLVSFPVYTEATRVTYMETTSYAAKAAVLAGWSLAAFVGTFIGSMLLGHRSNTIPVTVAAILIASIVVNATLIPHPAWMIVVGIIMVIATAWAGLRAGSRT